MDTELQIAGRKYLLERPDDLEQIWSKMENGDLDEDERLPYWVEIWPAAIFLSKWLLKNKKNIKKKFCLDLGCGLGLTTMAAADCGARVLGLDYEPQALLYARDNAILNNSPASWVVMDWRQPAIKPRSFAFIWGADIIYETRFFVPLLKLFSVGLAPGGEVWLAGPQRQVDKPFWDLLQNSGWNFSCMQEENVPYRDGIHMQIHLWRITRNS